MQWCKAAAFKAGPPAPARPGQAWGLQPGSGHSSPRVIASVTRASARAHLWCSLGCWVLITLIAHSSPLRAADRTWGQSTCFSSWRHKWLFAQGALGTGAREIVEEVPWGSLLHGHLDQSPETPVPRWVVRAKLSEGKGDCHAWAALCGREELSSLHSLGRSSSPAVPVPLLSLSPATASLLPTGLPVRY